MSIPQNIWHWLQRSQPLIVLVASLALTYFSWQEYVKQATHEARAYFEFQTQQIQTNIEERMRACEQILHGASGLFAASRAVSREEFRAYISSLHLQENYPGIQGVGFSLIVPSNQLATHEATIRNQGFPNYVVKPPGLRQFYTPVIYLEPFADRNLRAFGYDMFAEPVQRVAMERARDTGQAALSGKVFLVQKRDTDVQAGTLLYVPVYKNGHPTTTVEERRANIIGWVYSPYCMTDLMSGVLGQQLNTDFGVESFDGTQISAQSLLYKSVHTDNLNQLPIFYKNTVLNIAGHQWTTVIHTLPGFDQNLQLGAPRIVVSAGIIGSLLLFLLTWQLVHGRELALKIANQRETQFKALFDHSMDAMLLVSIDGKIFAANPAATKLFGYTEAELQILGRSAIVNVSDPRLPDFLARRKRDGFSRGELTLQRKDGSNFEGELSSSVFIGADTQVQTSIIIHDITERKRMESVLYASEGMLRTIYDLLPIGLSITDPQGHIVDCNNASEILLAITKAEHLKRDYAGKEWSIIRPDGSPMPAEEYASVRAITEHCVVRDVAMGIVKPTGTTWISVSAIPSTNPNYGVIIAYIDITANVQAQQDLQQREQLFRAITDTSPLAIYMSSGIEQQAEYINPTFTKLFGYVLEEVPTVAHWWPLAYPDAGYRNEIMMTWQSKVAHAIDTRSAIEPMEVEVTCKDGAKKNISWGFVSVGWQNWAFGLDYTDSKQAQIKLEQTNQTLQKLTQEAQAASIAKSTFLANMSHELRTPLNGILGYAHLLQQQAGLSNIQKRQLQVIEHSGRHLLNLINDILDLAKIEAGKLSLSPTPLHLAELLGDVLAMVQVRAEDRDLRLINAIDELPELIEADGKLLQQILLNLLGNAVKFTSHGHVTLKVEVNPQPQPLSNLQSPHLVWLHFAVLDSGYGIPADKIYDVFKPFEKLQGSDPHVEGTGLGLSICGALVQIMGGKLELMSRIEGGEWASTTTTHPPFPDQHHGTMVWFVLCLPTVATGMLIQRKMEPRIIGIVGAAPRILVVDDNSLNCTMLIDLLTPLGCEVIEAANGDIGLAMLLKQQPAVVITDIRMPGIDGYELIKRSRQEMPSIKIIATSASVSLGDRDLCLKIGADAFLLKPINIQDLYSLLAKLLGIEWLYASEDSPSVAEIAVEQPKTPDIQTCTSLLQYAEAGDIEALLTTCTRLRATMPMFAHQVQELAENLRLEELQGLLRAL